MPTYRLRVNGRNRTVESWDPDQPRLYVLPDDLDLHGPGYPVIRFPDVPSIDIALIDRPDQPSMGAGATGVRLTTVPFKPARVKAALSAKQAG